MKLMRQRKGDSAEMAVIEFVGREGELRRARPPRKTLEEFVKEEMARARATSNPNPA